ncbi:MAG TPA: hypothetical protein VEK08_17445 [Planctomycetota bacterium]|nr:hypothetical protein [Planctomycetota bacterium]
MIRAAVLLILVTASLFAAEPVNKPLVIRPLKDWKASREDVKKVLYSAAGELWTLFPGRELKPIEVEPKGGPITLYKRGPNGEIQIKLDTGGTLWAQYAFQFAHEMGHVLCSYDEDDHKNKWFEESICELASLFVLRRMSKSWESQPPYPNWKNYAPHLKSYADERMKTAQLPAGQTLAQWYADNAPVLASNATDRERNNVVATALLPLFEAQPERWEAVTWLNAEKLTPLHTFKDYLFAWRRNAPEKHRPFITMIAKELGVELD